MPVTPVTPTHDASDTQKLPGFYTKEERSRKILKYKSKVRKWKIEHANVNMNGRSRVAKSKLRYFGRFIKYEDIQDKLLTDDQIVQNNKAIDFAIAKQDYNTLVVNLVTQNPSEIK